MKMGSPKYRENFFERKIGETIDVIHCVSLKNLFLFDQVVYELQNLTDREVFMECSITRTQ